MTLCGLLRDLSLPFFFSPFVYLNYIYIFILSCFFLSAKFFRNTRIAISVLKDMDIKEIVEVFVDRTYAGKTVGELEEAHQITIYLVLRDDLSVLPKKNTILRLNDIMIIRTEGSE